jgi:hypothetical protein
MLLNSHWAGAEDLSVSLPFISSFISSSLHSLLTSISSLHHNSSSINMCFINAQLTQSHFTGNKQLSPTCCPFVAFFYQCSFITLHTISHHFIAHSILRNEHFISGTESITFVHLSALHSCSTWTVEFCVGRVFTLDTGSELCSLFGEVSSVAVYNSIRNHSARWVEVEVLEGRVYRLW